MSRRALLRVLLVFVVLLAGLSVVAAQEEGTVVGRPSLELSIPNNHVTGGQETTLSMFVSNNGDLDRGGPAEFEQRVQTARNVRLRIRTDDLPRRLARGFQVKTGTVLAGSVPPGAAGPFDFRVEIADTVPSGTYELPVEVTYDYTNYVEYSPRRAPQYHDVTNTVRTTVTLVVEQQARFSISAEPSAPIPAGDSRTVNLTVTNTGNETAIQGALRLAAVNSSIFFGSLDQPRPVQSVYVPRLSPGESRRVSVTVGAAVSAAPDEYLASGALQYSNPNGVTRTSDRLTFGVRVGPEQTFAVRNVTDSLRAGENGVVRGEVVNTGPNSVTGAVVSVQSASANLRPMATEVAVGSLSPGESAPFEFEVAATNRSSAGSRQLTLQVQFRNPAGDQRTSQPLDARISVAPEQTFALRNVVDTVRADGSGVVRGVVVNTENTSVSNAVVVIRSSNPNLVPRETEYAVGTLGPNASAPFEFRVDATNGSQAGPRPLSFRVRYRDPQGDQRQSDTLDARISVAREQTFALRDVESSLRVGQRGTLRGTVVNTGNVSVSNAAVVYRPENPNLQPRETSVAVGDLAPGESAPFAFTIDVQNGTDAGQRTATLHVRYRDSQDDLRQSSALDAQVTVAPEQTFAVRNVTSTLRVSQSGDVRGEVVNTANETVTNVVVVFNPDNPNLVPRETEYAVGTLAPGESAAFDFRTDVSSDAEQGPRQVRFRVRYRDRRGDQGRSDPLDARVDVAREVDEFRIDPVNATVQAGSGTVVTFRITNVRNQTLRDVDAKLFTTDPLSSENDQAFVSRLAPGENATLRFRVSAAGGAIAKDYPVSLDFSYTDERGDTVLSDTYRVPVQVTEAQRGGGLPFLHVGSAVPVFVAGGTLGVVLLGLGWWVVGRRRA